MSTPSMQAQIEDVGFLAADRHEEWDEYVAGHPWSTLFHTTSWKRVLEDAFGHIRGHVAVLRNPKTSRIEGGLVIYAVRSWLLGHRLVGTPFADASDPLIRDAGQLRQLMPLLIRLKDRVGARYIELKVRSAKPLFGGSDFVEGDHFKYHVLRLASRGEEVWPRLSRTAVRRMVNKALKTGVTVKTAQHWDEVVLFHRLLGQSRQRLGLPPIPYEFFQGIWKHFQPGQRLILLAFHKGLPVGAILGLKSFAHFHLEYSGELVETRKIGVGQLLYWKAVEWAVAAGCHDFGFGRTFPGNAGLMDYKEHWGTSTSSMYSMIYPGLELRKVRRTEASPTYHLARRLFAAAPASCARVMGRMFYRHWG